MSSRTHDVGMSNIKMEENRVGPHGQGVEHWNPDVKIRQDLFGVDILALRLGEPVLVVQATTGSNHVARRTKLDGEGHRALGKRRSHD